MYQPECPRCKYGLEWRKEAHCWECGNCGYQITDHSDEEEPLEVNDKNVN